VNTNEYVHVIKEGQIKNYIWDVANSQWVRDPGTVVNISGIQITVDISGDPVSISGQPVTISGSIITISGQPVNVSGSWVTVASGLITVTGGGLLVSGTVNTITSGTVVAKISGETVVTTISGQTVVTSVSGNVMTIASGTVVALVSGQAVTVTSGLVIAFISGQAVTSIDQITYKTWQGKYFRCSDLISGLAAQASRDYLVFTSNQNTHLKYTCANLYDCTMELHETPTVTSGGTKLVVTNTNRVSGDINVTTVYASSTVSVAGTQISYRYIPQYIGWDPIGSEFVLKQNDVYLLRVTSLTANNIIHTVVRFYEGET
jgi:hypothetical protein